MVRFMDKVYYEIVSYVLLCVYIFNTRYIPLFVFVLDIYTFRHSDGNTQHDHTQTDIPHNFLIYLNHELELIT